jgi:hypothetical protein
MNPPNGFRRKVFEWSVSLLVPTFIFLAIWTQAVRSRQAADARERDDAIRTELICQIEEYHIDQLKAARDQAMLLGIPVRFEIPQRSEECIELDG